MKTAFLFAGQGAQYAGMGKDLYEKYEEFRNVFDNADVGFDLKEVCFEDKEGLISLTKYTQPCMVAFAAGVNAILKEKGIRPDIMSGLSLGEYSALHASGVWDADTVIRLAAFRGEAMTRSAEGVDAAMTAVMGLSREELQECVDACSDKGVVSICNDNCPGQLVLGGERQAVETAAAMAKEKGARRCTALNVSGPFHTVFMEKASEELLDFFSNIEFGKEEIPVVYNYLGRPRKEDESIRELLGQQVKNGVRMTESIKYMLENGVRTFIEIGPGKTLTGFVKRTAKDMGIGDILCCTIEKAEDIEALD